MNYKFSNREKILLKLLGFFFVVFVIFFIEMKMLTSLTESRDALRDKVQIFNATKQQLSQLKSYRDEATNSNSSSKFSTHLKLNSYINQGSEDIFNVNIQSTQDLLELLRFIHGLNLHSIDIKLVDENKYILSVSFND